MNTYLHTTEASSLAQSLFQQNNLSGVEYLHRTVSVLTHVYYNDVIQTRAPVVLALGDSFLSIRTHLEKVSQSKLQNRQVRSCKVRWMASHADTVSSLELNEKNVAAAVQLILQRSGVDELVLALEDDASQTKAAEGSEMMEVDFHGGDDDGDISPRSSSKRTHHVSKPRQASTGGENQPSPKRGRQESATKLGIEKRKSVSPIPPNVLAVFGSGRILAEEPERNISADSAEEVRRNKRREGLYGMNPRGMWRPAGEASHENSDLEDGEIPQDSNSARGHLPPSGRSGNDQARRGSQRSHDHSHDPRWQDTRDSGASGRPH